MSKGIIGSHPEIPAFSSVCLGYLDEKAGRNQENAQQRIEVGEGKGTKCCSSGNKCPTMMVFLFSAVLILSIVVISLLVLVVELKLEMREFQTQFDDLRNDQLKAGENALTKGLQPAGHPSTVHHFSDVLYRNVRSARQKQGLRNGALKKKRKSKKTSKARSEAEAELKRYCISQIKNATFKQAIANGLQPGEEASTVHQFSDVLHRNVRSVGRKHQSQNGSPKKKRKSKKTPTTSPEVEAEMEHFCAALIKNVTFKLALTNGLQPAENPSTVHHFSDVFHRQSRSVRQQHQSQNGAHKKNKKSKTKSKKSVEVEVEMKKFCDVQLNNATLKQLETVEFEGVFYSEYNYNNKTFANNETCKEDTGRKCEHCEICRGATIEYHKKYSPLHVYHLANTSTDGSKLIKKIDNSSRFEVVTPGSYLLHLNIVMVDKQMNHSIGVFVNAKVVLACPKGGFLMPQAGKDDIDQYRMCNIDGMVNLKANDVIEIKTMEPKTMVRLQKVDTSLFKLILLHPTGAGKANTTHK